MTDQELADIEARLEAATPPGRVIFESGIIEKDVPKLIAALREAWESDAESLKLYRAARARTEAANFQLSDLKKAVKELLALKECGTFKEAEVRERVKDLLAGIAEKTACPSTYAQGEFKCEKDEDHLHRIGDVEHAGGGKIWMSI